MKRETMMIEDRETLSINLFPINANTSQVGPCWCTSSQSMTAFLLAYLKFISVLLFALSTKTTAMPPRFQGIITPLATPLLGQDEIDQKGTQQLLEHVIQGGVSGVFLLGSTGEGPSLSYEARRTFVEYSCQVVAGRCDVLVHISDTAFGETVALAKVACASKASAVVVTTPYYFSMSQRELIHYADQLVQAIPSSMPIVLYNIPFLTKNYWDAETVRLLANKYPQRIVGIKDSSGDMEYFAKLCRIKETDQPDFSVMVGPEHLLPDAMRAGGDGGVNGGSNVLPHLLVSLYQALVQEQQQQQGSSNEDLQERIQRLMAGVNDLQQIYQKVVAEGDDVHHHPFSRFIAGTKAGLAAKGICGTICNEPFSATIPKEREAETIATMQQILSKIEATINQV